jgi:hypothetical protein
MDIEGRIGRLEIRQEALVEAMNGLTDVMEQTRDLVVELMAWLQEPPSSDLSDTLKAMTGAIEEQSGHMQTIGHALVKLPAQVARAVTTGEVP